MPSHFTHYAESDQKSKNAESTRSVLTLLFIASGAAGLIYESLWARYLGMFVGHTAYAQIVVLAIFLGGMSLGALLISSRSERLQDPLVWYARVELLIGLIGFVFHPIFNVVTHSAYETLFPVLGNSTAVLIARWMLCAVLILPQSILLGTTFPLMSAAVLRRFQHQPGRSLAILYFANSFGAAAGVLLAGFFLIAFVGLPGTLLIASVINILVALAAFLISYSDSIQPNDATDMTPSADSASLAAPVEYPLSSNQLQVLMMSIAGGTAVASFIYEIGWIRMLSLVFGSATHSFELMLSAFILGLSFGSLWVSQYADRWRDPVRVLGLVQWTMGAAALATLPLYSLSFEWMAMLLQTFAKTELGYGGFSLARYGISLAIMLPSTFCAGITLPLITRILLAQGRGERAIGRVYGVNTLGSIGGVILAGLVLLPWLGLKQLIIAGATLDMILGVVILFAISEPTLSPRRFAFGAAAATIGLAALGLFTNDFSPHLLSSTVFRTGRFQPPAGRQIAYHQDGRTATVTATREPDGQVRIMTNGKPDASLPGYWFTPCTADQARHSLESDAATQTLAALLPLAHMPQARTAAVIGFGSGMSSHFLLGSPSLERLTTIEIEPAMVEGARAFFPANRRVYEDPRSQIVADDAKSYFATSQQQFDLIFSEPSNPWVSGVSSLFTTEFYQRIRSYLSPHGVFGQWLHLYEIDDGLVLSILAALHQNFPAYEIFFTNAHDLVIVASNQPHLPRPDWSVARTPAVQKDLCHNFPLTDRMLDATRLFQRVALAPLLNTRPYPNSDFYPTLDLYSEQMRYLGKSAEGFRGFDTKRFNPLAPFFGHKAPFTEELTAPLRQIEKMRALALSTQLQNPEGAKTLKSEEQDPTLSSLQYTLAQWQRLLSQDSPPSDWKRWLADMQAVENALHGGTSGVVNETFYQETRDFLARVDAPGFIHQVVSFRHGLAAWDFHEVDQAGASLLESIQSGKGYLSVSEYLDGVVVAKLMLGESQAARQLYDQLVPAGMNAQASLGLQLLNAYINAPGRLSPSPSQLAGPLVFQTQ